MSDVKQRAQKAAAFLRRQISELQQVGNRSGYKFWCEHTKDGIEEHIGVKWAREFDDWLRDFSQRVPSQPLWITGKRERWQFLVELLRNISRHPDYYFKQTKSALRQEAAAEKSTVADSRKVFIVHGHDTANRDVLEGILKELGFAPVILADEAEGGRTLIEKFEEVAEQTAFAFAIFTPDDLVQVGGEEYSQPRPNAIFELGWFYGQLGRERVCILIQESVRMHSDLNGIMTVRFGKSVKEAKERIEKELRKFFPSQK